MLSCNPGRNRYYSSECCGPRWFLDTDLEDSHSIASLPLQQGTDAISRASNEHCLTLGTLNLVTRPERLCAVRVSSVSVGIAPTDGASWQVYCESAWAVSQASIQYVGHGGSWSYWLHLVAHLPCETIGILDNNACCRCRWR